MQSRQCYAKAVVPPPPASDPAWQGHTDGAVYACSHPWASPGGLGAVVAWFWAASPPGVAAISAFIDGWNDRCHPFTWTKTADEILPHATRKRTSDA